MTSEPGFTVLAGILFLLLAVSIIAGVGALVSWALEL
jgi:hypothetical protein